MIGLSLVIVVHAAMNVALETARPDLRDPEYGCRLDRLRTLRARHPDRPLVVALGSSRTQMGLCPAAMPPVRDAGGREAIVFNFGMAGCGPLGEWINLNRLLGRGLRPDRLLVEVLPPALHQDGDGRDFVELPRMGLDDLRTLRPYCAEPGALVRDWCELRASAVCTARYSLVSRLMPNWLPFEARLDYMWDTVDESGWLPYPHPDVTPERRAAGVAHARQEYRAQLTGFRVSPVPDRALRDILVTCRREGIPVALYRMPEAASFRAMYPPQARGRIDEYLNGLGAEFGVPVFDATRWVADGDFADGHHLLRRGAAAFSERFARQALGPWLGSRVR